MRTGWPARVWVSPFVCRFLFAGILKKTMQQEVFVTRFVDHREMGGNRIGWLDSRFHFSFGHYYNPGNVRFGALRVLNDDIVQPRTGFDTHPHQDMEILTYIVDGELAHEDSLGNRRVLSRGQAQYMSAGTGIWHSERNPGHVPLRFLKIWILPDAEGYAPRYRAAPLRFEDRIDRWMPIAGPEGDASSAPIRLHADASLYAALLTRGRTLHADLGSERQAYLALIEGESVANAVRMQAGDALEVTAEALSIEATADAHLLLIEMAKSDSEEGQPS